MFDKGNVFANYRLHHTPTCHAMPLCTHEHESHTEALYFFYILGYLFALRFILLGL